MCEGDKPQHLAGLRRANEQVGILPLCEVDDDCVTRNLSKLVKCRREGIWRVNSGLVNVARPCNHWRGKGRAWRVESGLINMTRPSRSGGRKRTWVHLCRLDGVHCRPTGGTELGWTSTASSGATGPAGDGGWILLITLPVGQESLVGSADTDSMEGRRRGQWCKEHLAGTPFCPGILMVSLQEADLILAGVPT